MKSTVILAVLILICLQVSLPVNADNPALETMRANTREVSGALKTLNGMLATYKKKRYSGQYGYPQGTGKGLNAGKFCGLYYEVNNAEDTVMLISQKLAAADCRADGNARAVKAATGTYTPCTYIQEFITLKPVVFKLKPYKGYWFALCEFMDKQPYDATTARNRYGLVAFPAQYGRTGWLTLIMNEEGTVYALDRRKGEYMPNYPGVDPAAHGWHIYDSDTEGLLAKGPAGPLASIAPAKSPARVKADQTACRGNLGAIAAALKAYAAANDGNLPPDLSVIRQDKQLICPGREIPDSYVYVPGLKTSMRAGMIMVFERFGTHPEGRHIVYLDGQVSFFKEAIFIEEINNVLKTGARRKLTAGAIAIIEKGLYDWEGNDRVNIPAGDRTTPEGLARTVFAALQAGDVEKFEQCLMTIEDFKIILRKAAIMAQQVKDMAGKAPIPIDQIDAMTPALMQNVLPQAKEAFAAAAAQADKLSIKWDQTSIKDIRYEIENKFGIAACKSLDIVFTSSGHPGRTFSLKWQGSLKVDKTWKLGGGLAGDIHETKE
ncbi:DUF2950 family protein [Planctomycetota bacterium]